MIYPFSFDYQFVLELDIINDIFDFYKIRTTKLYPIFRDKGQYLC